MIHYLLLAHKNFNQLSFLIKKLKTKNSKIYLHVDGKVKFSPEFENVIYIKNRVKTYRWWFSQIRTEVTWIKQIFENMKYWDHLIIISGQCRPIKKIENIEKYIDGLWNESCLELQDDNCILQKVDRYYFNDLDLCMPRLNRWLCNLIEKIWYNMGRTKVPVINIILSEIVNIILPRRKYLKTKYKIYKWGNWIVLSYKHTKRVVDFLKTDEWKKFYKSFRMTNCADEIFLQTMLYNSPMKNEIKNELLWYVKWEKNTSSPYIITLDFYDEIKNSGKLFARKFDINKDWAIVEKLEKNLSN